MWIVVATKSPRLKPYIFVDSVHELIVIDK